MFCLNPKTALVTVCLVWMKQHITYWQQCSRINSSLFPLLCFQYIRTTCAWFSDQCLLAVGSLLHIATLSTPYFWEVYRSSRLGHQQSQCCYDYCASLVSNTNWLTYWRACSIEKEREKTGLRSENERPHLNACERACVCVMRLWKINQTISNNHSKSPHLACRHQSHAHASMHARTQST